MLVVGVIGAVCGVCALALGVILIVDALLITESDEAGVDWDFEIDMINLEYAATL